MSGTSFNSTRAEHNDSLTFPVLSVVIRAGLLGLGLAGMRRMALFTK
jgi:hypothetical protein